MFTLRSTLTALAQMTALPAPKAAKVRKALQLLATNPRHPSLETHKYDSLCTKTYDVFEAYAENKTPGALRIFWRYGPDELDAKKKRVSVITTLAITAHP